MQNNSGQMRRLVLIVLLVLANALICRGDVFDAFCKEAVRAMQYNEKLFKEAQAGFSLVSDEVCNPTMLSACQKMKSVAMLQELASFKNMPPKAQDAIRGGLEAYDQMVDEWAHLYWDIGRHASQKDFREGKNLVVNIITFWENTPGYKKIYSNTLYFRILADKVLKAYEKDLAEIYNSSHEYSPEVLKSDNLLGRRLKKDPTKWPLSRDDRAFWDIPKVYGLDWLKPDFELTSDFSRDSAMLDEFAGMVGEASKLARVVGAAYSSWQEIANKAVGLAPKVAKLSDSRFAQDNLTADFRETMEDAADTLIDYHEMIIKEINATGYRQLDKCMNFLDTEAGRDLANKSGPLYKGTNGSTKEIPRTFELIAKQMIDMYNRISTVGRATTLKAFCDAGLKAMKSNEAILDKCKSQFRLDNIRICDSNAIDAFKATAKLSYFGSMDEYRNLPPKTREMLGEVIHAYDDMLVGFSNNMYLLIAEDAKNDKFIAAKTNQAQIVYEWSHAPKNWQEQYKKMLEMRKQNETARLQFKKDMEEIKRYINNSTPRGFSSNNALGNAIKKNPNRWPIRDSDLSFWQLNRLYNNQSWMTESCDIYSGKRQSFREFDEYALKLQKLPAYQDSLKRAFDRWYERGRLLATYGSAVSRAASSKFATDYLTPAFVNELKENATFPEIHCKHITTQLKGDLGQKLLDETAKILSNDGAREMMNHNGTLYRGISTTRSLTETYQQLARFYKEHYLDVAK
ncbi:MAG: hypothetical protein K5787_15390 [Lentisphaeria bacterium]|nr:hypothetical protein [Lentisphaeria bacterium]